MTPLQKIREFSRLCVVVYLSIDVVLQEFSRTSLKDTGRYFSPLSASIKMYVKFSPHKTKPRRKGVAEISKTKVP